MDKVADYISAHPVCAALWGLFAGASLMLIGTDPRMASKLILLSSGFPLMLGLLSAIMARDSGEPKLRAFAKIGVLAGAPGFVLGHLLYLPFSGSLCIAFGCLLVGASMVFLLITLVRRLAVPSRSRDLDSTPGVNQDVK